jgi:hypothetical protein
VLSTSIDTCQRRSIIADYSDSDDNTNQSTLEQPNILEANTGLRLADPVFTNVKSKLSENEVPLTYP